MKAKLTSTVVLPSFLSEVVDLNGLRLVATWRFGSVFIFHLVFFCPHLPARFIITVLRNVVCVVPAEHRPGHGCARRRCLRVVRDLRGLSDLIGAYKRACAGGVGRLVLHLGFLMRSGRWGGSRRYGQCTYRYKVAMSSARNGASSVNSSDVPRVRNRLRADTSRRFSSENRAGRRRLLQAKSNGRAYHARYRRCYQAPQVKQRWGCRWWGGACRPLRRHACLSQDMPIKRTPASRVTNGRSRSYRCRRHHGTFHAGAKGLDRRQNSMTVPTRCTAITRDHDSRCRPQHQLLRGARLSFGSHIFRSFSLQCPAPGMMRYCRSPNACRRGHNAPERYVTRQDARQRPGRVNRDRSHCRG